MIGFDDSVRKQRGIRRKVELGGGGAKKRCGGQSSLELHVPIGYQWVVERQHEGVEELEALYTILEGSVTQSPGGYVKEVAK